MKLWKQAVLAFLLGFTLTAAVTWPVRSQDLPPSMSAWFIVVDATVVGTNGGQELRHDRSFKSKPECEAYMNSVVFRDEVRQAEEFYKQHDILVVFANPRCLSPAVKYQRKDPDYFALDRA